MQFVGTLLVFGTFANVVASIELDRGRLILNFWRQVSRG